MPPDPPADGGPGTRPYGLFLLGPATHDPDPRLEPLLASEASPGPALVFAAGDRDAEPAVPPGMRVESGPAEDALLLFRAALRWAADADADLLVIARGAQLSWEATELLRAELAEPLHFAAALPRWAGRAAGSVTPLPLPGAGPEGPGTPLEDLGALPERYLYPEVLGPVVLLGAEVLAVLDDVAGGFEGVPGALLGLLAEARRRGYRCRVSNRSLAWLDDELQGRWLVPSAADRRWLAELYPEQPDVARRAREEASPPPVAPAGGAGTIAPGAGAEPAPLLLDASNLVSFHNGTSVAILGILEGLARRSWDRPPIVWAEEAPARFHRLAERFPGFALRPHGHGRAPAAWRLNQPWDVAEVARLAAAAPRVYCTILDTIAWDGLLLDTPGAGRATALVAACADGLFFLSAHGERLFRARFPIAPEVATAVHGLSLDPRDHGRPGPDAGPRAGVLVVGNPFPHKLVDPTVDLLARAFPDEALTAFGGTGGDRPGVRSIPSGPLPGPEVEALYQGARAVVFPSCYEGFGLPMLQALACGTPVLVRDTPLAAELAGGWTGPGSLHVYRRPWELVEILGQLLAGLPGRPLPLGPSRAPGAPVHGWPEVVAIALAAMAAAPPGSPVAARRARTLAGPGPGSPP